MRTDEWTTQTGLHYLNPLLGHFHITKHIKGTENVFSVVNIIQLLTFVEVDMECY